MLSKTSDDGLVKMYPAFPIQNVWFLDMDNKIVNIVDMLLVYCLRGILLVSSSKAFGIQTLEHSLPISAKVHRRAPPKLKRKKA